MSVILSPTAGSGVSKSIRVMFLGNMSLTMAVHWTVETTCDKGDAAAWALCTAFGGNSWLCPMEIAASPSLKDRSWPLFEELITLLAASVNLEKGDDFLEWTDGLDELLWAQWVDGGEEG